MVIVIVIGRKQDIDEKTMEKWKRNDKNSGFWALPPVLNMPFRVIHVNMNMLSFIGLFVNIYICIQWYYL